MASQITRILFTGANGQLGREFSALTLADKEEMVFWSKDTVNICDERLIDQVREANPTHVVNCAAYTAVDLAESNAEVAYQVNAEAAGNLAKICASLNIPLVHFSSDYVYHNNLRRPLVEEDPTRPKGVYAKSKLKGEKLITANHSLAVIFRVSWLYSTFGNNFPKTILRLAASRKELNVVNDQEGAPTYGRDLAEVILEIIRKDHSLEWWRRISGTYNYSNTGTTNWYEIARRIVHFSQLNCRINPIPSREFPTAAPRPRNSKLNLSKFRETFGLKIRPWDDALEECLGKLQAKDH
ncbi:MAG: dTDP-4-dehydrorhamnose reductase [Saprospiraceae bacterium]|nr:dTDP-4-dehydrorhamnose reductase [Saprospiraceae bacterium]